MLDEFSLLFGGSTDGSCDLPFFDKAVDCFLGDLVHKVQNFEEIVAEATMRNEERILD